MPLPFPNLDDRNFDQLVEQALAQIRNDLNTDWDDLSAGDPGVVLLEVFAYLTDQMIYRLNRLPRKVYVAFLRLLGVTIQPPAAASVPLKFWHPGPVEAGIHLPRGSLVSTDGGEAAQVGERPVFTIVEEVEIPPESNSIDKAARVLAYHCERVEESLGQSKGVAGQVFQVRRPPVIARLPREARWLELAVGVEVPPAERRGFDWTGSDGKFYHLWQEVDNFAANMAADEVFLVDRQAGLVYFAPAARSAQGQPVSPLAAIPPAGREIRIWYPHGGGEAGNVRAGQLKALVAVPGRAELPAVELTNPEPARGGLEAESLEDALVRGPQEIYSRQRAVTAREFEQIVLRSPYVARARAIAQADLWQHAAPGTVDIILAPRLTKAQALDLETLQASQDLADLRQIEAELGDRSPIGIHSQLRWARYKRVWVQAQITYGSNEEAAAVEKRVTERLNRLISPLPPAQPDVREGDRTAASRILGEPDRSPLASLVGAGWPFGQQLRVADLYNLILVGEGSKILITSLELHLEHAPGEEVACLAADCFQPRTWYTGSGRRLFRSTNDGSGWELILHLDPSSKDRVYRRAGVGLAGEWVPGSIERGETVRRVCPSPDRPGMVALLTEAAGSGPELSNGAPASGVQVFSGTKSSLYLSLDCGESWYHLAVLQEPGTELQPGAVEDMAWLLRGGRPVLLLATDGGLLEVNLDFGTDGRLEGASFYQVPVLPDEPSYPVYALAVVRSRRGSQQVVAALKGRRGVYISAGAVASQAGAGSGTAFAPLPIKTGDRPLGEDVRHLRVQDWNGRIYLWAGVMALSDNGLGCYRWQFDENSRLIDDGLWVSQDWKGGSCLGVAFDGGWVYAGTAWGGLLRADFDERQSNQPPAWNSFPSEDLPQRPVQMEGATRRQGLYEPLIALDGRDGVVMIASQGASGGHGIYRRVQFEPRFESERYEKVSRDTFLNLKDAVTLPPDWLLISGPHQIQASFDSGFGEDGPSRASEAARDAAQSADDARSASPASPEAPEERS